MADAEKGLSGALGRLIALSEAYPDLKANTNFLDLQAQLGTIEDKLAAARRFFNNAVSEYKRGHPVRADGVFRPEFRVCTAHLL